MEKSALDPDAYLASLPPERRGTMTALDALAEMLRRADALTRPEPGESS